MFGGVFAEHVPGPRQRDCVDAVVAAEVSDNNIQARFKFARLFARSESFIHVSNMYPIHTADTDCRTVLFT